MLEKVDQWPYIEKLRVIHLLESDFNLMVGILYSRRTMQVAESLGALGEGNAGSRKDRSAEEVHLLKHILYGIIRVTKTNAASFDNDAKSCFDRIVPLLVSLICQRYGMDRHPCELLLKVWYHSRYHVKTQHGISDGSFGGPTTHSTGQGGKGSANFWSLVSAIIESCMPDRSNGFSATDPFDQAKIKLILTAFVDDASHWTNRFKAALHAEYGLPKIIHDSQTTAQWWEQLLYVTGGKLELPKCFYYMISWSFDDEGLAEIAAPDPTQPAITITDSETHLPIQIRQKDCYKEHVTLGACESPAPNYYPECKRLRLKSRAMVRRLATAAFSPHEAQTFFRSVYIPSISYTFPTGILRSDDCRQIQGELLRHLLPQLGFNPHTPRELVHGPRFLGGCGIQDLFTTQGSSKCIRVLQHLRNDRPLGSAMLVYLRWAQRLAGISTSILQHTHPLPQLVDEQWLETLREFLHASDLSIHTPPLFPPTPQRDHDVVLMDYVCNHESSSITTQRINRCRLFLRADTLADLTNAQGTHLLEEAWNCTIRLASFSDWPVQPHVGPTHRKAWQTFLTMFCHPRRPYKLRRPLGKWNPLSVSGRCWPAFYEHQTSTVFLHQPLTQSWRPFQVRERNRRTWKATRDYPPDLSATELRQTTDFSTLTPIDVHSVSSDSTTVTLHSLPPFLSPKHPPPSTPPTTCHSLFRPPPPSASVSRPSALPPRPVPDKRSPPDGFTTEDMIRLREHCCLNTIYGRRKTINGPACNPWDPSCNPEKDCGRRHLSRNEALELACKLRAGGHCALLKCIASNIIVFLFVWLLGERSESL